MKEKLPKGYVSVTEVLEPLTGIRMIPKEVLEAACVRGTAVHHACSGWINGIGMGNIYPDYSGYLKSAMNWLEDKEGLELVPRFFCHDLKLSGECDCVMPNKTGLTIVDFKTSQKEHCYWKLQGSAYAHLARKAGMNITAIKFVRFEQNGSEAVEYDYEEDFDTFLKCLEVYRFFEKTSKTTFLDYL